MNHNKAPVKWTIKLLIITLCVAMLPLSSFAAVSPSESGNGRYWTQKSSLKLLNAETTEYVQTGYRLYDTVSSSCVSNATSAGLFSQHSLSGNFFTLSFPKGRDWKVNSNYNLTLRGSAISPEKSEYIYDSLSSEGTSLNYYQHPSVAVSDYEDEKVKH